MTLIATVGTNPLPVYVTYKLCAPGRAPHVILIGSKDVADVRRNLQKVIDGVVENVELEDPWNVGRCLEQLNAVFGGRDPNDIHVDYTAGTKVMSNALRATAIEHGVQANLRSILSPRDFRLHRDDGTTSEDARAFVRLDIERLAVLQGLAHPQFTPFAFRGATLALRDELRVELESSPRSSPYYSYWAAAQTQRKWKTVPLPSERYPKFIESFASELPAAVRSVIEGTTIQLGALPVHQAKAVREFLDFRWLEGLTQSALWEVRESISLHTVGAVELFRVGASHPMQLDVVTMRGYQILLFSCTRAIMRPGSRGSGRVNGHDDSLVTRAGLDPKALGPDTGRAVIKEHAFEVELRARQLGGDEARAFLVSVAPPHELAALERDLRLNSGTGEHLRVIGLREILDSSRLAAVLQE